MNDLILAVPVLLPIAGGMAMLFHRSGEEIRWSRKRQLLTMGLVLLNSLLVGAVIAGGVEEPRRLVVFKLYASLTVMFKLDAMGSVFAGLVAFLWPLATLYAFEYMEHEERKNTFFAFYLMTYGITMGIAMAGTLVTLYLFYEMLTFVTLPLVMFPLTVEAVRAARTYLYYSIGGAAFAFIGLVFVLGFSSIETSEFVAGGMLDLARAAQHRDVLLLVYVMAFFGFGVKAALFPCYKWLPKAAVAPTPVTALLHAVAVVKSGAFAVLRLTYFSFGIGFLKGSWAQWVVMTAVLVTIAFGSTMAVREVHWKRRLAYSTVSNLSYILFGATVMSPFGLAAALCHMVAHAFMKISAFFCAGAVMHRSGKTYIYELDGMGKQMPVTFGCLTISSLSLMGVPLFAGFISKWNLCQAAFECGDVMNGPGAAAMAANGGAAKAAANGAAAGGLVSLAGRWLPYVGVAVILYSALMTGIYMLTVLVRAYFPNVTLALASEGDRKAKKEAGKRSGAETPAAAATDPTWRMLVPLVVFSVVIVIIGVHSAPLTQFFMRIGGEVG